MLDNIPQKVHRFGFDENAERDKCYVPDFRGVDSLFKEFGINNDIDLALQKPQYKSIIDSRMSEIPITPSPGLSDDQMLDNMVSREYDVNELREVANHYGKEYRDSKNK